MKASRITAAAAGLAIAVAPVAAATSNHSSAHADAQKQCRAELKSMGRTTFRETYGTDKNRSNAFGKCVSHRTRQNKAAENKAQNNAAKICTKQQNDPTFAGSHGGKTFSQFYGAGKKGKNAFGKCVSSTAKALTAQKESSQVKAEENAAKQCRAEQKSDPAAFKNKYGTNRNKRNAFGKCVSSKAKQKKAP